MIQGKGTLKKISSQIDMYTNTQETLTRVQTYISNDTIIIGK